MRFLSALFICFSSMTVPVVAQEDYEKWLKEQQAGLEEMELEEATYMETVTAEFDAKKKELLGL